MKQTGPIAVILLVVLLAGLVLVQWQQKRRLDANLTGAESVFLNQKQTLAEQETAITKLKQELASFQHQFARSQDEAKSVRERLQVAEKQIPEISWERNQLRVALTNAISHGDQQAQRLREMQTQLTTTLKRFTVVENDLADAGERIERLTNQLHSARLKLSQLTTNHSVLMARYNLLTASFNATSAPAMTPLE